MLQIDNLTKALVENQKMLTKVSEAAAAAREQQNGVKVADEARPAASAEDDPSSPSSTSFTSSDVAELRVQLAAAHLQNSRMRSQLADSNKEPRVVASNAWKSSAEVEKLMEDQANGCDTDIIFTATTTITTTSPSSLHHYHHHHCTRLSPSTLPSSLPRQVQGSTRGPLSAQASADAASCISSGRTPAAAF